MNLSYFSEQFKIAIIIPIFKEGNKDDFLNDRPISLLPAISKVFERIIFERVYSYVEKFKLLDDNQFGFRKKRNSRFILKLESMGLRDHVSALLRSYLSDRYQYTQWL